MGEDGTDELRKAAAGILKVVSVNAFHEKVVRSQLGSFAFLLDKAFLTPVFSSHLVTSTIGKE